MSSSDESSRADGTTAPEVPTVAGVATIRDAAVVEIDLEASPAQSS